ncbi:hypothetical protein M0R45_001212 [Rubus argutus]|uniref:H/ACA ribonucleoprotein complex subunit n=1 Tax=Rubus argutus TaxID=59490 RepID=A0AAW1VM38_RUBAR
MRPPRGGGSFRGNRGGGGFRGRGDGGFRGGRGGFRDEGPPSEVVEVSTFVHACEGDAVTKLTHEKIPYFNAPIYLQNKTQIGKVDEIFGPINESYFSVKVMEGIVATSYSQGDKFYIDPAKLLPLARFLPQPNLGNFLMSFWSLSYLQLLFLIHENKRDRNQLFLEVEDVEAEDHRGVAEVEVFVAGDLRGVAEDLQGVVAVVASGAEGDFRVTLCNISIALPISRCHYFRMLRAHKSHTFMLVLVVTCGFVYVYVYLAE